MKRIIPIIMASDDYYSIYTGIAIHSIIRHVDASSDYRIYVLEEGISEAHKMRIRNMSLDNVSIEFVNVKEIMSGYSVSEINHLKKGASYRLIVDKIFDEYSKMLYLDSDIIVNKDIAILYDENLDDCVLGATRGKIFRTTKEYITDDLGIPIRDYFNSGVLVIDVNKFREEGIGDKALEMLSKRKYLTMDQDVLNILCRDRVKIIDGRWNVEWEHLTGYSGEMIIDSVREDMYREVDDPFIIHYTSPCKPWMHPELPLADFFWQEARNTVFYEEVLIRSIKREDRSDYSFPWRLVRPSADVIIYGCGKVGREYIRQIRQSGYCNIVAVSDKRIDLTSCEGFEIIKPDQFNRYSYDLIVVAVESEELSLEIKNELKSYGIDSAKIKWDSPKR